MEANTAAMMETTMIAETNQMEAVIALTTAATTPARDSRAALLHGAIVSA